MSNDEDFEELSGPTVGTSNSPTRSETTVENDCLCLIAPFSSPAAAAAAASEATADRRPHLMDVLPIGFLIPAMTTVVDQPGVPRRTDSPADITATTLAQKDEAAAVEAVTSGGNPAGVGDNVEEGAAETEETARLRQQQMYARFQAWALRNYGETGKTKTVTRTKYDRVVAILNGLEPATADNSKLRFWIKAKGFRLGCCDELSADPATAGMDCCKELYIPSKNWVSAS